MSGVRAGFSLGQLQCYLCSRDDYGLLGVSADRILQIADASAEKPIAFGQINVTGNWDAVASFGITAYPHIMLFQGFDNHRMYKGAFAKTRSAFM
jgi:hypothetical protein